MRAIAPLLACVLAAVLLAALALSGAAFADDSEKSSVPTSVEQVGAVSDGVVSWQTAADAAVGEWTPYLLEGTLPSTLSSYTTYYYEFVNTIDEALEVDVDTVVVTLVDAETGALTDLTDYAVVTLVDGELHVAIDDLLALGLDIDAADTIQVTYDARLIAGVAEAGASSGAVCTLVIVYAADGEDAQRSAATTATLFTWALSLLKVDADTAEALAGAVFTIQNADGEYVSADGTLVEDADDAQLTCDDAGELNIVGLASGTYTVVEVEPPDGYEAVEDFTLVIEADVSADPVELSASVAGDVAVVTAVDAESGVVSLSVADPASGSSGAAGTSDADEDDEGDESSSTIASAVSSLLSKTGDSVFAVLVLLAVAVAAGLIAPVARSRARAGRKEDEG